MAKLRLRVVAYENQKNIHHYIELPNGSTVDNAISEIVEGQAKYGSAWIEIYEDGNWEKYLD